MLRKFLPYHLIIFYTATVFGVANAKKKKFHAKWVGMSVICLKQRDTMTASMALLLSPWNRELNVYFRYRNAVVFHYTKRSHNRSGTDCLPAIYYHVNIRRPRSSIVFSLFSLKECDVKLTVEYFCNKK
jgi:hypothetical protein